MLMDRGIEYRRLRAPRDHGQALIDPPPAQVGELLRGSIRRRSTYDYDLGGRSLTALAHAARQELLTRAVDYTRGYRDVDTSQIESAQGEVQPPVLLAGHQPQLVHPGVWFKNFTLDALARQHGAVGVNLIIDCDAVKEVSVAVPSGSVEEPLVRHVAFDRPGPLIPHEERKILDRDLFDGFGRRVEEAIKPLVPDPLVRQLWPMAVERSAAVGNLGLCLAQSRHRFEGQWGGGTLELPQSDVCQLEAFHWFVSDVLAGLPRFWEIHNGALAEYRRAHRLRNAAQPVPDLAASGSWLEAPFWIWQTGDPVRRAVFAEQRADQLVLSDRQDLKIALDLTADGPADRAVEQLAGLARRGIKLRTRALTTTMFARLMLGDLFVHGIGGAKYDQVTDLVMHGYYGLEPPDVMAVSATMHLPIEASRAATYPERQIGQLLRELEYHPERHTRALGGFASDEQATIDKLIEAKSHWINTPKTSQNARTRHFEITRVNRALQRWLAAPREELLERRQRIEAEMRSTAILSSREYAFCLFPEKTLRHWILEMLARTT